MVTTAKLSEEARQSVAEQIGRLLSNEEALIAEADLELGESLPVRMLSPDALSKPDGSLREATQALGEWHHQIVRGDEGPAFTATSVEDEAKGQEVVELAQPAFAAALARAINQLDDQLADDDDVAELLIAPAYYLVAILISGREERVLVVDRPERLSSVEVGYIYPAPQFVEALGSYPPSAGVPDKRQA